MFGDNVLRCLGWDLPLDLDVVLFGSVRGLRFAVLRFLLCFGLITLVFECVSCLCCT